MNDLIVERAGGIDPTSDDGFRRSSHGLYVPVRRGPLRGADLFAGAGGFSLGMQQGGIDVVAALEWDDCAALTYLDNLGSRRGCAVMYTDDADRKRFAKRAKREGLDLTSDWIGKDNPDTKGGGCRGFIFGDATKVTGDDFRSVLVAAGADPSIDVCFGGPPCQGMSMAGKQKPDDPRNNLVLEFVRIADELGASMFMMENVPPLIQGKKFRPLFDAVVERARDAGFGVVATILDACNYGVPQYRRRAIVVGSRGDAAEFQFPMPTNWAFGSTANKRWSQVEDYEDELDAVEEPQDEETLPLFKETA